MGSSKEIVTYSSFPKLNNPIKTNLNSKTDPWVPQVSHNSSTYPAIDDYDSAAEEEEEDEEESGTDGWASLPASGRRPEVNLRNVLLGLITIVTGKTKTGSSSPKSDNSGISFLGSNSNGDSYLLPSVYLPSAPPLLGEVMNSVGEMMNSVGAHKSVLEAEPPEWLPDSSTNFCMQCSAPFAPLTRGRHHCRFCGGVFCRVCTKGRCLLPRKFRVRDPQRVCDGCYDRLDPVQGLLLNQVSNASQTAKHDVLDWTCMRGWLNLPIGMKMEDEIYKATNSLRSFTQVARFNPEKSIPQAVLNGASGLAILTVAKAGAILTYKLGTGLVVARRSDGTWSAPSAILSLGLGWGAQIGGELMDFIIVLRGSEALKTFTSRMHFSLGAGLSAAAGPIGRVLEADLRAGERGSGVCYTYSCSKGAFVGVSLEGNFVMTRLDANLRFYGDPYLTTTDILLGIVERPKAAGPLYSALDDLYSKIDRL